MSTPAKILNYRGYEIMKQFSHFSVYYLIYKDGNRESGLILSSVKACKTVIDTYLKKFICETF
jgi:hypothetical protein